MKVDGPLSPKADALAQVIADAIDKFRAEHNDCSVFELLGALEAIRHRVTEAWIIFGGTGRAA